MLWPLVCALTYLLLSARVLVDVALDISEVHRGMRITLRAWGLSLCLDMPDAFLFDRKAAEQQSKRLRTHWALIRSLVKTVRWGHTQLRMRVGTQDAALTAMAAGAVRSCASAFQAMAGQRFPCEIRVEADFHKPCFVLAGRCIFSLVPGDIMFAVARAAVKKTQREGFKWLSIPLKA